MRSSTRILFPTLIFIVAISGMSQGLVIPLLTILLSSQGVSSFSNGFNATALYLGMLLAAPFMELPLRKLGYQRTIFVALGFVIPSIALFPVLKTLTAWFILRFTLGIGDILLHYSCQMWISSLSQPERKGRNMAMYGVAYGVGFCIGPLGIYLLPLGEATPFLAICLVFLLGLGLLSSMNNSYPEKIMHGKSTRHRYIFVARLAWFALLPSFMAGFLEATINNSLPIYILNSGLSREWVPIFLTSFTASSLVMLMPMGYWSDNHGRKRILQFGAVIGAVAFFVLPLVSSTPGLLVVLLLVVGGMVGCFYSLGLAYIGDLLPADLIPVAGIIIGINYGVASMIALSINGYILQYSPGGLIFSVLGGMYVLFAICGVFFQLRSDVSNRD